MITKKDVGKKLKEIFEKVNPKDQADLVKVLQLISQYITEHYSELDEEVKKSFDKMIEGFLPEVKRVKDELPEGREKRELNRMLKEASGKHFSSKVLVKALERTTDRKMGVLKDMRKFFIQRLQNILDFLSDVVEPSKKGHAEFAKIGLFYLCVDELLAAFQLAQHSFINQSYSHIRTVSEALDKIELFNQQPKWAELWMAKILDPKKEFWPSAVRKKLGKNKIDPLYSFFSELGAHGTFRGIQARTARSKQLVDGRPQIHFWIGGCPQEQHIIWVNVYLLYALTMMLLMIIRVYENFLNQDEVTDVSEGILIDNTQFSEKHFIPWARKAGLDVSPLVNHWKKLFEILDYLKKRP